MEHEMAQALRMQRAMQKSGEAAALAATIAIKKDISLREVPYNELLQELKATGCFNEEIIENEWLTEIEEIKAELASEKPGRAVWSANLLGINENLKEWISSDDESLSKHSAFALGLLEDKAALPELRKIVEERDKFVPSTSRSRNQKRICSAIHLIGKLNDHESIDELLKLIKEDKEFDVFSHAIITLLKIGEAFPALRDKIADGIIPVIAANDFFVERTVNKAHNVMEEMSNYIRIKAAKEFDKWNIPHKLYEKIDNAKLSLREKTLLKHKAV
jgi:HEAT repeat protein